MSSVTIINFENFSSLFKLCHILCIPDFFFHKKASKIQKKVQNHVKRLSLLTGRKKMYFKNLKNTVLTVINYHIGVCHFC